MGRKLALSTVVVAAVCIAIGIIASPASPTSIGLSVGEVLVYDLTIEVQVHGMPSAGSTAPPITLDTAMQGTETMTGLRADPDGSVHASVDLAVHGNANGQKTASEQTILLKISPDGAVNVESGGGALAQQYFSYLTQISKSYRNRTLHVGDVFHTSVPGPAGFASAIDTTAKVVGMKQFQGYPTFAIQSTGSGKLDTSTSGVRTQGTLSVAGTTYYDQADNLFVGTATRANVDAVVSGVQSGRLTVVDTTNIVLASVKHIAAPAPAASAMPEATPSPAGPPNPSESPTEAPTAPPTPSGYYTPTPPAPTTVPATTRP